MSSLLIFFFLSDEETKEVKTNILCDLHAIVNVLYVNLIRVTYKTFHTRIISTPVFTHSSATFICFIFYFPRIGFFFYASDAVRFGFNNFLFSVTKFYANNAFHVQSKFHASNSQGLFYASSG